MTNEEGKWACMADTVRIFKVKQGLGADSAALISNIHRNDFCFFRFSGGNTGETARLIEDLCNLKTTGVFLIGIFRFPFRFEGKRRLQTAMLQYQQMRELCDTTTYIRADGMLETLNEETSLEDAYQRFDWIEDAPIRSIEELIQFTNKTNIDAEDVRRFLSDSKGPIYIRTFEGDKFDEPLNDILHAPYLPHDYTEGRQLILAIGCSRNVGMDTFQLMNLRFNDLFHKCELFKLGTYFFDAPAGNHFRITLMVNGISDPYPQILHRFQKQRLWLMRQWHLMAYKGKSLNLSVFNGAAIRGETKRINHYETADASVIEMDKHGPGRRKEKW